MPRLTHPDLGVTVDVTDAQARVLARSGWLPESQAVAPSNPPVTGDASTPDPEEE